MPIQSRPSDSVAGKGASTSIRSESEAWTSGQWAFALTSIGALALALRLYFVINSTVDYPFRGDAYQYFTAAWNLVHRHTFSISPPTVPVVYGDNYRDPGFPVLLAICLALFGKTSAWYTVILITQAALGACSVPLLMAAARQWLPDRWVLGAGILMAIWPHSITVCGCLVSESLSGFLVALSLALLSTGLRRQRLAWLALSGSCFAAAGLTAAILLPFAPLLASLFFWLRRIDGKQALTLAAAAMLLPFAWQVRNAQLPPEGHMSGQRALLNFVQGSWPEYHSSWRAYVSGDAAAKNKQAEITDDYLILRKHPSLGAKRIYQRFAQSPLRYAKWYLSKPAHLWGWGIQIGYGDIYILPVLNSPFDYNPAMRVLAALCQAINPLLGLLATWGVIILFIRKRVSPDIAVAMATLLLYVTGAYAVLQAEPRYAVPFRGIEILLAAAGASYVHGILRQIKAQQGALPR